MEFESLDRWRELLGLDPAALPPDRLRAEVSRAVRELCRSLRQRPDRLGVAGDLDRLQRIGTLLEVHGWLSGT